MRGFWVGLVVATAVLFPIIGKAQVYQFRTPPPDVSAAAAAWQINGEPIIVGGLTYYPTRAFRLFDGQVMAEAGMYERVPVYSDMTLEPYMEVYVPLGSGRMRVYERRHGSELAGTTGSHVPTFPVASPSVFIAERLARTAGAVATAGSNAPSAATGVTNTAVMSDRAQPRRTSIITAVPHSAGADGVWLEYEGARWYSDGPAVSFSRDRFEPTGTYRGFPVYREKGTGSGRLWVSVVKDGPLAPYRKQ